MELKKIKKTAKELELEVIDGNETIFADKPMPLVAWAPIEQNRRIDGGAVMLIRVHGNGGVRIPAAGLPEEVKLFAEGPRPGSRGKPVPTVRENDTLVFTAGPDTHNRWLYVVP